MVYNITNLIKMTNYVLHIINCLDSFAEYFLIY